ncbi:transposase-like zinc-binding domain-containing protein [Rarobacter faecitabidus]|uniref:transposase-like zinc-binding domain-containing protein n=1 Tax=Rarobacter faecitabidus TaxID=13243 RepID=UPI003CCC8269
MNGAGNSTRCGVCDEVLVKNGKTAAGTQRWICRSCGASSVRRRPDVTRAAQWQWCCHVGQADRHWVCE